MAIVEFKDVTRIYTSGDHELKALNQVDFTLEEGKFVVLVQVKAPCLICLAV